MSRDADAGSATVWALIVVLLVWVAAALAVIEAVAIQTRHQAEAVADAAALAAASDGGLDPAAACAAAHAVAESHGAVLVTCVLGGPVATIRVSLAAPDVIAWAGRVSARARAGPANTGISVLTTPSRAAS